MCRIRERRQNYDGSSELLTGGVDVCNRCHLAHDNCSRLFPKVTADVVRTDKMTEIKLKGSLVRLGASCYEEDASLAALENDSVRALQVPFNLLDGRMSRNVFSTASERSAGILVRSAYLRGVLTRQLNALPEKLAPLRDRAKEALTIWVTRFGQLPKQPSAFVSPFQKYRLWSLV